jgi:hypothetical protein
MIQSSKNVLAYLEHKCAGLLLFQCALLKRTMWEPGYAATIQCSVVLVDER